MAIPNNRPKTPADGTNGSARGNAGEQRRKPARRAPDAAEGDNRAPRRRPAAEGAVRRTEGERPVRKRRVESVEGDLLNDETEATEDTTPKKVRKQKPANETPAPIKDLAPGEIKTTVDDEAFENIEYAKDPVTGKIYQKLPKTKMDSNGMPMIQAEINDLDLNGAANMFLSHLRVPPSKEEINKLRQERIRRAKAEREADHRKRAAQNQEELERRYNESLKKKK